MEIVLKIKRGGIAILMLFVFANVFADCYTGLRQKGLDAYNNGDYQTAKKLFISARDDCPDVPDNNDIESQIQKCERAIKNAEQSPSSSQSSVATTLYASRSQVNVSEGSSSEFISITSNKQWSITKYPDSWCQVSKSNSGVTLTINANPNTYRSTYIQIATNDNRKNFTIYINQAAKTQTTTTSGSSSSSSATLSLSKTYIYASASGTTEYITVTSNRNWEIQYPSAAMYSVTKLSNTSIKVVINKNTGGSRQDFFNIETTDGSKTVKVSLSQGQGSSSSSSSGYSSSNYNSSSYRTKSSYSASHNSYKNKVNDWYSNAGRTECSWWSPKFFVGTNWGYEMSVFDFRFWCFEIDPISIGIKVNYSWDYQLYYMPKVKAYLPMTETWSSSIAIGPTFGFRDYSEGNYFQNTWFIAELAFRCHHRNSAVNTDLFIRYNDGFAVGVAWSFTKAWRTDY